MKKFLIILILLFSSATVFCQQIPLNAAVQNRLNEIFLNGDTSVFTGFRTLNWLELQQYLGNKKNDVVDSIFGITAANNTGYFLKHATTNNFIQAVGNKSVFAVDPYVQLGGGYANDNTGGLIEALGGLQFQGVCNNKFSYSFGFAAGISQFVKYVNEFIDSSQNYVPGIGHGNLQSKNSYSLSQFNANITYLPSKHFLIGAGYGKNFIGDGYRSLILSDNASSYPYLRVQARFWKITYNVLYNKYTNPRFQVDGADQRKYSVLHYLGINFSKRFQLGLYDNILWLARDTNIQRGIDVQYLSPIIFLRPVEYSIGSPDNALLGLTYKYQFYKHGFLYGQIVLDDMHIKDSRANHSQSSGNKYALQVGIWNQDFLGAKNLSWRFEWNGVRPYTYDHDLGKIGLNYTHNNQALADPFNANFHEFISIFNYHNKRWYGMLQDLFTIRGENPGLPYNNGENLWGGEAGIPSNGVKTLTGNKNKYFFNQLTAGYLINPRNRLALQADVIYRKHTSPVANESVFYFSFGIRTNIFNYYHDF